jgi:hypothetical protein
MAPRKPRRCIRPQASFLLVFGALLCGIPALAGPDGTWIPGPGSPALPGRPAGRQWQASAVDTLRGRMYVTGGYPGAKGDLWLLDLRRSPPAWSLLAPSGSGPGDRYGAALVYDSTRDRLLLFGGCDRTGTQCFADVWQFPLDGGGSWQEVSVEGGTPPARMWHGAVYEPARDRLVVVGGQTIAVQLDDAWALELAGAPRWRRIGDGGASPGVRSMITVVHDPVGDRVIRFGGRAGYTTWYNDVWALSLADSGTWNQLSPAGTPPAARLGAFGVFDAARRRLVLYDGSEAGVPSGAYSLGLGDTLAWTQTATSAWPGPLQFGSLGLDPAADRAVLFGGCGISEYPQECWAYDLAGGTWSELYDVGTPEVPTARADHSVCLSGGTDRMYIVGGYHANSGTGVGDSWRLDAGSGAAWTRLFPSGEPLPDSYGHVSVFDEVSDGLVIFGRKRGYSNDTWTLPLSDGGGWTQLLPPGTQPPAQEERGAVYDPVRHRMILVGYAITGGWEVWALPLDGVSSWTRLTSSAPSPLVAVWGNSAVYDAERDELVVLGGDPTSEVWGMTLGTPGWRRLYAGPGPSVRGEHSVTLDTRRRRVLVSGGYIGGRYLEDIWEFDLAGTDGWRCLSPAGPSPLPRGFHSTAYDWLNDRLVLFGGHDGTFLGDTWFLQFDSPTDVAVSIASTAVTDAEVGIAWQVSVPIEYAIERRDDGAWRGIARTTPDGQGRVEFRETGLAPDHEYRYRLGWEEDGVPANGGEVSVRTRAVGRFALLGVRPSVATTCPSVAFRLPDAAPTTIRVFDVSGRCLATNRLESLPPGVHEIALAGPTAPGCYVVTLTHGTETASAKFVLLK